MKASGQPARAREPCHDGEAGAKLVVAGGDGLALTRDSSDDRLGAELDIAEAHVLFVEGSLP